MTSKDQSLQTVALAACTGPIFLFVARLAIDQEASIEGMASLAVVSLFGLMAFLGQRWAVLAAPAVFFIAMVFLLVHAVMEVLPAYWPLVWILTWCAHELWRGEDLKQYLLDKGTTQGAAAK